MNEIKQAAKALVDKLDLIEENPQFQDVWGIAYVHGLVYTGPNWADELKNLREVLARYKGSRGRTEPESFDPDWTYFEDHSWHWLLAERSSRPSVCEWVGGAWHCVGDTLPVSPEEMYRRGWRWHSQVKVPKHIRNDCPSRGDIDRMG
jgi:hypothetical protein